MRQSKFFRLLLLAFLVLFSACSGGGGGGESGGDSGNSGSDADAPLERNDKTGIRIIHGGLDAAAVSIRLADSVVQTAHYNESTRIVSVPEGPVVVVVERANAPGDIVTQIPITLAAKTEYNVFLSGMTGQDNFSVQILPEATFRPEKGFARVRLAHSLVGKGRLSLSVGGVVAPAIALGSLGDYLDVPSGAQILLVLDQDGNEVTRLDRQLLDREDVTYLVTGSTKLGVLFVSVFEDLD